jgi:hypothetical protein
MPSSLAALREPSFARYLASVSVSTLGSGMAIVVLAFAVLELGTATDLGLRADQVFASAQSSPTPMSTASGGSSG